MNSLKNNELNILQINIRSLYSNKDILEIYLLKNKIDIALLNETWQKDDKIIKIKGYQIFYLNHISGYRGLAIPVKNTISANSIPKKINCKIDYLHIAVQINDKKFNIITYYINHELTVDMIKTNFKKIIDYSENQENLILGGDANAHSYLWGSEHNNSKGNTISTIINNSKLILINDGSPTRLDLTKNKFSAIDLTLIDDKLNNKVSWEVDNCNLGSDHFPLLMKINTPLNKIKISKKKSITPNYKKK